MAWLGNWTYRKKIKLRGDRIDASKLNVPIPITINTSAGPGKVDLTAIFTEITTNSKKIAVTMGDGVTQLPAEISYWDNTNKRAQLFTKADLVGEVDNYLYFYYDSLQADNTDYVGETGDTIAESIWTPSTGERIFHFNKGENGVVNGDFPSEAGWSYHASIVHNLSSGLQFIDRNGQAYEKHMWQVITGLVIGQKYRLSMFIGTISHVLDIQMDGVTAGLPQITTSNDNQVHHALFTATATTHELQFLLSSSVNATALIDRVALTPYFEESSGISTECYCRTYIEASEDLFGGKRYPMYGTTVEEGEWIMATWSSGTSYTVFWVSNRSKGTAGEHIISAVNASGFDNSGRIYVNATTLNYQTKDQVTGLSHGVTDEDDHVFALTVNGTALALYVDGNLVDSDTHGESLSISFYNIGGKDYASSVVYLQRIATLWCMGSHHSAEYVKIISAGLLDELGSWYEDIAEEPILGAWRDEYANRVGFTLDSDEADSDLTDFPVALFFSGSSGKTDVDITDFFDKMAYPLTGDTFTGDDGDPPNPDLWVEGTLAINGNKLRGVIDGSDHEDTTWSVFHFSGDFDVQIDWACVAGCGSVSSGWAGIFKINKIDDNTNQLRIYYNAQDEDLISKLILNDNVQQVNTGNSSNTGKFKITRVGGTWTVYYDTGGGWVQQDSRTGMTTDDVEIELQVVNWTNFPSGTFDFDNFVINSGSVVWPQGTHPNRKKIAVTDEDGLTFLSTECDFFDAINERAVYQVRVPSVLSARDKKIYCYYDPTVANNDEHVGDPGDQVAVKVWDSDFTGVWHLSQEINNNVDNFKDSTELNNDGQGTGLDDTNREESIVIPGIAIDFDGNEKIAVPDDISLQYDEFSCEIVFYPHANTNSIVTKGASRGTNSLKAFDLAGNGTDLMFLICDGITNRQAQATFPSLNAWHYFAGTWDGSITADKIIAYLNGVVHGTGTSAFTALNSAATVFNIAGDAGIYGFDGTIAEIRYSKVVRSAAWTKATWRSMFDKLVTASSAATKEDFNWLTDAQDEKWKYRIPITIDHSKIDAELTDFPLAVQLSADAGVTGFNASHFFEVMDIPVSVDDDFTGDDGDAPDSHLWVKTDPNEYMSIQSNKLNFDATAVSTEEDSKITSKFDVSGNFDLQIDFSHTQFVVGSTASYGPWFRIARSSDDTVLATIARYLTATHNDYWGSGLDTGNTFAGSSDSSGKYRITRISGLIKVYYWTTQWEWDGSTNGLTVANNDTSDISFQFYFQQGTGADVNASIDNFVVNSGTIIWTGSELLKGKRVAFTASNGITPRYAELEYIKISEKKATYHVKIPTVSAVEDTLIYLYYDSAKDENTGYIGDVYDRGCENVWADTYAGVWHFGADDPQFDSSKYDRTGLLLGHTVDDFVEGLGGVALDFDGVDMNVGVTGYKGIDGAAVRTVEVIFKTDQDPYATQDLVCWGTDLAGEKYHVRLMGLTENNPGGLRVEVNGGSAFDNVNDIIDNEWHYGVVILDGTTVADHKLFVDGEEVTATFTNGTQTVDTDGVTGKDVHFGAGFGAAVWDYYEGLIDSVRISSLLRSDSYIKATYHSKFNSLLSFGAVDAWAYGTHTERIRLIVDSNKVKAELTDFPMAVILNAINASELFTELAYPDPAGDDFTGDDGDDPNSDLWDIIGTPMGYMSIQNNKLNFNSPGADENPVAYVKSRFVFTEDFDIQVDFDITTFDAPDGELSYAARLDLRNEAGTLISSISRARGTGTNEYYAGGTDTSYVWAGGADSSGKLRCVRVSGVVKVYEWSGSQWEWDGSSAGLQVINSNTSFVHVWLAFEQENNGALNADYDNFLINSGAVIWRNNMHPYRKKIAIASMGGDLRSTELDYDDLENDSLVVHSKIPTLSDVLDTVLFAYFDNAAEDNGAIGDIASVVGHGVWDDDFLIVMHFSDVNLNVAKDSTVNELDAANSGIEIGGYEKLGRFVLVQSAVSTNKIEIADNALIRGMTDMSLEVLGKMNYEVDWAKIVDYASDVVQDAGRKYRMYLDNGGTRQLYMAVYDTAGALIANDLMPYDFNVWTMFAFSFKGGSGTGIFNTFLDGELQLSQTGLTGTINNNAEGDLILGRDNYAVYDAAVAYTEFRLSRTNRSEAWLRATYDSLLDNLVLTSLEQLQEDDSTYPQLALSAVFKSVSDMKILVGGSWKTVSEVKITLGEVWKTL